MTLVLVLLSGIAALGVIAEVLAARRRRLTVYRAGPTLSNLGCGAVRGLVALSVQGVLLSIYAAIHARWAIVRFDERSALAWVSAFVLYDLAYYWVHRLSHGLPVLWAAHSVHHQATELDLSVILRAPMIAPLQAFPLYALLAIGGVPPTLYVAIAVLEHTLMAWLHTRFVPDLGAVGWLLNTPSHHRVHHAADPTLSRANYGGVLIVWDRLFGTFRAETQSTSFGIAGTAMPLHPLRANLLPWLELWQAWAAARGAPAKLRALLLDADSSRSQLSGRSASKPLPGT